MYKILPPDLRAKTITCFGQERYGTKDIDVAVVEMTILLQYPMEDNVMDDCNWVDGL